MSCRGDSISAVVSGRVTFLRVPVRPRGGLRPFRSPLEPTLSEVGIDRFDLTVAGQWRPVRTGSDCISADEYIQLVASSTDDPRWFRAEMKPDGVDVHTRADPRTTLGTVRLSVKGLRAQAGSIRFTLKGGNITRTLHHLLIDYGHAGLDFAAVVGELHPLLFFAHARGDVPKAFGGNDADNWISDHVMLRDCLGVDPFAAFHPIYVRQLQRMVGWLVLPMEATTLDSEGDTLVSSVGGIACRIDWGNVRVPQMEAYFERRHNEPLGAVRMLASAVLVDLDDARVWRYITNSSLWAEREDDSLSVGLKLRESYRLALYAKSQGRVRFEVRRLGKAASGAVIQRAFGPEMRLLAVIERDRTYLLDATQWQAVGRLLEERPAPQISDLVYLCTVLHGVSAAHDCDFATLLTALLTDGGLKPNAANGWSSEMIEDLARHGILHRTHVRRRDHQHPNKRYTLRPTYRAMINLISTSLLEGHELLSVRGG